LHSGDLPVPIDALCYDAQPPCRKQRLPLATPVGLLVDEDHQDCPIAIEHLDG
jgi:hypothetical protein